MNAPDKIYIDDLAVVNDCATKVSLKQLPNFSEYIRKDALLEWVKEQASITEKLNGKGAMLKAWNTLIDKIESL